MSALPGSAAYAIGEAEGPLFTALELVTVTAAGATTETLRASDLGYVTRSTDAGGTQAYPPTLVEGFGSNRSLDLRPGAGFSAAWGDVRLAADDRRYDAGLVGWNSDQRAVRLLIGRKARDYARGLWTDPPLAELATLFSGIAQDFRHDGTALVVPMRDYSAYLERPYLSATYGGTGLADGSADIKGRYKPRLRGGSVGQPVKNISPVRIDVVNNVWQISDQLVGITNIYEDGAAVFTSAGDVSNLWAGSTPAGQFRTSNANGLFQLGSPLAGQITCDAWGQFPAAGVVGPPHNLANYCAWRMLFSDIGIDPLLLDATSFTTVETPFVAYNAGWYWDGSDPDTCLNAVNRFLRSYGARVITRRDGIIACLPMRAIPGGTTAGGTYTTAHIVSLSRAALPSELAPPVWRCSWGYQHNHTIQTSGLNGTVTDARRQFLATADRFSIDTDIALLSAYARPNDLAPIPSALTGSTEALAMATKTLDLWGVERRLYSVELPVALALRHDVGDVISISWPLDNLDAGQLGRVVGEQLRMSDATSSLLVLV